MLLPMSPTSSMFLIAESREHPMHVGSLQLFKPPEGADAFDIRTLLRERMADDAVAPVLRRRPRRSVTTLGQWGWEVDQAFDLEHHVRHSALPRPGRVRELLELVSRLHSTLLDRYRPLWEMHLIEGLDDGRFAIYSKVHHSVVDGVSALRMLASMLSEDAEERDMPAPWAPRERSPRRPRTGNRSVNAVAKVVGDTAGLAPSLARTVTRAVREQGATMSFSAPQSIFNVKITGARRFAAQSWPMERLRAVGKAGGTTLNDVVLAMCSGALRRYLLAMDELPTTSLIAMVPVSLHGDGEGDIDGGNAIGLVTCRLGTDLDDAGERLAAVHRSMTEGKESLSGMSRLQILAMSGIGIAPLGLYPALKLVDTVRPPFNLIISNVPGPRRPLYWNGARLDGLYPLSIPLDGQALNITCTSYTDEVAFGLTGCRRTVPHLQHLLTYLDDELRDLELATGA
ncbi:diacylglycerol O-acyltransferase [Jatrophihabitans endophyticus]|uniref:Diacylglycerol O-acyltransferase n=1 Tax=Jatrophihabitans endophyticus TaxID=1206085 RepID=A0A1M5C1Q0_9ACTN|nr:wax ester/triacylglycerol synthase family O-acyltransferase [Jatrophihabitans endophyticus]SHF48724.1 diacylglycerol O-acyltransferase [Jatrophihabitans endophyticus]